jgi:hypothetical protein
MRGTPEDREKNRILKFYFAAKQGKIRVSEAVVEIEKLITKKSELFNKEFTQEVFKRLSEIENG